MLTQKQVLLYLVDSTILKHGQGIRRDFNFVLITFLFVFFLLFY